MSTSFSSSRVLNRQICLTKKVLKRISFPTSKFGWINFLTHAKFYKHGWVKFYEAQLSFEVAIIVVFVLRINNCSSISMLKHNLALIQIQTNGIIIFTKNFGSVE